jgi:SAM-dependent methyltransferase
MTKLAKGLLSQRGVVLARCLTRGLPIPRWGNLRRVRRFSAYYGFERGTPIDRYYLDRFLAAHRDDIRGDVLEIQGSGYTTRYGRGVRTASTVDIAPEFGATFTCDLAQSADVIPAESFDCFLLPNTLSVLRNLDECLRHALRVVRPGGTVIGTAAALCQFQREGGDYWRMGADGWREVASRAWPGADLVVTPYGNCLSATAALMGIAFEELTPAELDMNDPQFPVLVGLWCRKPLRK